MAERYRIEKWRQVYRPNAAMLRLTMERDGYRVYQWSDTPGQVYGQHKHEENQSHWIVSGRLEISVERVGTFLLEAGDRDFLPAQTYHTARVIGDEPVLYLVGELLPEKKKNARPKKATKSAKSEKVKKGAKGEKAEKSKKSVKSAKKTQKAKPADPNAIDDLPPELQHLILLAKSGD